ncbi:MAG: hypothetical protein NWF01_10175 [Candidatus Bathyarchaeota archaeon]|nr:hypothetical protein [Candidatus Bathyarchaeota archaeon]
MSETTTFSNINQAKNWLQTESATTLNPVQAKAKQLKEDLEATIQNLSEASKMLLDNSQREIEKRNMKVYNRARALSKISQTFIDRIKKLDTPQTITYDKLNMYAQETQKIIQVTEQDTKNWFPKISPFFIMDRRKFLQILERTKLTHNTLTNFLNKEYIKTKTLEDAVNLLGESETLEEQLNQAKQDIENVKDELAPVESESLALEQKVDDLKTDELINKLNSVNQEIENQNAELKNVLRHMQKPFLKMQALASFGGGAGTTPEESQKLNLYMENPFEAFSSEPQGYPVLKSILRKLSGLIEEDKLKLKSDKARKAEQSIGEILQNDTLKQLQVRCIELAKSRQEISNSPVMEQIKSDLSTSQEQLDLISARKSSIQTLQETKEQAYNEILEKINANKRTVEKDVLESLGKKIQIQ